jgi:hypothetical protein
MSSASGTLGLAADRGDGRQRLRWRGAALQAALGGELVRDAGPPGGFARTARTSSSTSTPACSKANASWRVLALRFGSPALNVDDD